MLIDHVLRETEGLSSASGLKNLSLIRSTDTSSSGHKNREGRLMKIRNFKVWKARLKKLLCIDRYSKK